MAAPTPATRKMTAPKTEPTIVPVRWVELGEGGGVLVDDGDTVAGRVVGVGARVGTVYLR
jgi:hypothetical protein